MLPRNESKESSKEPAPMPMTPGQQLDYLTAQVHDLAASVAASNRRQDPAQSLAAAKARAPRALRLLGYMEAMEHAGTLPRATADTLAPALEAMAAAGAAA